MASDYDRFDKKEIIACIFCYNFLKKNGLIFLPFFMKIIKSIKIEVKDDIYARYVLYKTRGLEAFP